MNVDRILRDAKEASAKKPSKREVSSSATPGQKRGRREVDDDDDNDIPTLEGMVARRDDERQAKMQKILEEADELEELDAPKLRALVAQFKMAIDKNVERRAKFADEPSKFMDSEVKVHELITEFHAVAASPELFPEFVRLKAVPSLLQLLQHENTDIAIEVVDLLKELTEPDTYAEANEADALLDDLVQNDMIKLLLENMERVREDESDENKQAVHNTLGIFENLLEIEPEIAGLKLTKGTSLVEWLLTRLRKKGFDENQLYSSEILSMLLISPAAGGAVGALTERGGLKKLIRCVAAYRKQDPKSADEVELVENLFNCICSSLSGEKKNQEAFMDADGFKLMVTMVRKKRYTQAAAIRALNYAIMDNAPACERLVDDSGLKAVFKAFMSRGKKSKKMKKELEQTEEHILNIIVQLFANLSDVRYLRLLNKFKENSYEKIDRLVELFEKYFYRLEAAENEWRSAHPDAEDGEDEKYVRRLDNGLYCLQLSSVILALISSAGDEGILARANQLLNQRDMSLKDVRETIEEHHLNVSDGEASKKMKVILENLLGILEKMVAGKSAGEGADEKVPS